MTQTKAKILLIEDDQDLAELYRLVLEHAGHQVKLVAQAQAALDELDKQKIDIIILDILLPQVNGLSIVHQLRSYEDWRQIPVIVLSNLWPRDLGITAGIMQRLGIKAYLQKSRTRPHELLKVIQEIDE